MKNEPAGHETTRETTGTGRTGEDCEKLADTGTCGAYAVATVTDSNGNAWRACWDHAARAAMQRRESVSYDQRVQP